MAGRLWDLNQPGGRVPAPRHQECRGASLGAGGGSAGLGCRSRGEQLGEHTATSQPRLSPREPGYSRYLQTPRSTRADSKTGLLKLASLPGPLQQTGGLVINQDDTRKVGGDMTGTMSTSTSTSSQVGAETDHPSTQGPTQIAGSPDSSHTSSSTAQQNGKGGLSDTMSGTSAQPTSSSQPSMADLKHTVYKTSIMDQGRVVNGSEPTSNDGRNSEQALSLSGNPTPSSVVVNIDNHNAMNSVLHVGTMGANPAQQPSKEPRIAGGDVLQNVGSCGYTRQINTLQQSPYQNGLISNTVQSPSNEENVSAKLKLDQVPAPQLVENSLPNPQNDPLQKCPTDSSEARTTENPALNSKGTLVQNPTEDSENFQVESSIVFCPKPQAETLKYTYNETGQKKSGEQHFQPTGSPILETELSFSDVFIQNQRMKRATNVSDDSEGLSEIDGFVDTLRNLDSPMLLSRNKSPRNQRVHSITSSFSTLPPIEEDQTNPKIPLSSSITEKSQQPMDPAAISEKPLPSLPTQSVSPLPRMDFLKTTNKEILTPGQMMKMQLEDKPKVGVQRASAENSIVFQSTLLGRTNLGEFSANSESSEPLSGESTWSRVGNSLLYANYQKSIQSFSSRSLDRNLKSKTASPSNGPSNTLPNLAEKSLSHEDISTTKMAVGLSTPTFLTNPFEGCLMDTGRFSLPSDISDRLMTGYSSLSDIGRNLQSHRISLPSDLDHSTIADRKPGKVTAFPDAWKFKPKEQGRINPRPGKIIVYDKPNFSGFQREINCDVSDCLSWVFPAVISIRIIRGCWVAYEKLDYKGKKFMFAEEDVVLVDPWSEEIEEVTEDPDSKPPPTKPIVIGSLRRAVRDYTTPQISLYPEANGEGKKLTFYGESEDIRIFGYPPKTTSIIVNSGLWFVYEEPFFEGQQYALEVGGYRTLEEWGAEKAQVGSLMCLQMGAPRVEKPYEPKVGVFANACFAGKSREVYGDSSDFLSRYPNNGAPLSNAGSIKVYGGIWIGYTKEGFRGHQYLLEEGEYLDWRSWGGYDEDLKSMRLIRADFSNPAIVLYRESNCEGEDSITVIGSVPDLEQADSGDEIQSINVLNGVWVAYEDANYSGAQYIVEKGIYRNPQDWGAQNCKISSLHPVLLVESDGQQFKLKIQIFSEYDFTGRCLVIEEHKIGIPKDFKAQSCRVLNGSWALYEGQDYSGRVFVVGEGEYPDLQSMGCRMTTHIRCVQAIPHVFSEPSITLHSLENFEGKEIELDSEVKNMISEGYNNLVMSLRVSGGIWVVYEHSNFRGRQVLLEPIEISNWSKYSSFTRIGSLSPVLQKRAFFQIKNKDTNGLLSVTVCQEDVKSGRVIIAPENKELEQLWFYENGLLKPKFAPDMSLQIIGAVSDAGCKVVLWSETRIPRHCWTFGFSGTIQSLLYKWLVLDIKGGKSYDRDNAVICKHDEANPAQLWEIQML